MNKCTFCGSVADAETIIVNGYETLETCETCADEIMEGADS